MTRAPDLRALVAQHGSPLLLVDCDVVRRQYRSLHEALPGVAFYYALKPLPHAAVVAELRDLGANFDLATTGEIKLVKAAGIAPDRCIHTHPIKSDADIRAALRFGIHTFVADNPDEIRKFVRHRRRAELLLRVSFRNPSAVVDLSRKFGCEPAAVPPLLEFARSLGVRVQGAVVSRRLAGGRPGEIRRGDRRLRRDHRGGTRQRSRRTRHARHRRRLSDPVSRRGGPDRPVLPADPPGA